MGLLPPLQCVYILHTHIHTPRTAVHPHIHSSFHFAPKNRFIRAREARGRVCVQRALGCLESISETITPNRSLDPLQRKVVHHQDFALRCLRVFNCYKSSERAIIKTGSYALLLQQRTSCLGTPSGSRSPSGVGMVPCCSSTRRARLSALNVSHATIVIVNDYTLAPKAPCPIMFLERLRSTIDPDRVSCIIRHVYPSCLGGDPFGTILRTVVGHNQFVCRRILTRLASWPG